MPIDPADDPQWEPWKSARSQWLNERVDRHSRAYRTLKNRDSKTIAGYMGISDATQSVKCTVCHAPAASSAAVEGNRGRPHSAADGVSCEHCHGPAQHWLAAHRDDDWSEKRSAFASKGFYDNDDPVLRARKCASCHVEIDHEIVAAGHPPLQFEMVAYAQLMKHWDDGEEHPDLEEGGAQGSGFDPTLWAIGQVEGLRAALAMTARRAGDSNYQSIGKFSHFKDKQCYQCHHKLVADAIRQGQGHFEMLRILLDVSGRFNRDTLDREWSAVYAAANRNPLETQKAAEALRSSLEPLARDLASKPITRSTARAIIRELGQSSSRVKDNRLSGSSRIDGSNAIRVQNIDLPWWFTTGAPEQTILAILALCPPAYDLDRCAAIDPNVEKLLDAANREKLKPDAFAAALKGIPPKLR